jgi:hypothetical protein
MHAVDPHGLQFPRPPVRGLCGNKHKRDICATRYILSFWGLAKRNWVFVASGAHQINKAASKIKNDPAITPGHF